LRDRLCVSARAAINERALCRLVFKIDIAERDAGCVFGRERLGGLADQQRQGLWRGRHSLHAAPNIGEPDLLHRTGGVEDPAAEIHE
jgi:hypothetical protein